MSFSMQINRGLLALSLLGFFAVLGNTVEPADAATPAHVAVAPSSDSRIVHISTQGAVTTSVVEGNCTTSVVRLRLASAPADLHQRTFRFATACRA